MTTTSEPVFFFKARIVLWIDADTVEAHPLFTPYGMNVRIRLRDRYEPEKGQEGHDIALEKAKAEIGDVGDYINVKNERHRSDRGRMEARIDPI